MISTGIINFPKRALSAEQRQIVAEVLFRCPDGAAERLWQSLSPGLVPRSLNWDQLSRIVPIRRQQLYRSSGHRLLDCHTYLLRCTCCVTCCLLFQSPLLIYLKISPTFVFSFCQWCVLDVVTTILFWSLFIIWVVFQESYCILLLLWEEPSYINYICILWREREKERGREIDQEREREREREKERECDRIRENDIWVWNKQRSNFTRRVVFLCVIKCFEQWRHSCWTSRTGLLIPRSWVRCPGGFRVKKFFCPSESTLVQTCLCQTIFHVYSTHPNVCAR